MPTTSLPKLEIITETLPGGPSFNMVKVKGGTFMMGDDIEDWVGNKQTIHKVEVSDFMMGQFLVTQELWEVVMGENPSYFSLDINNPVDSIFWYDAVDFCNNLSKRLNLKPVYEINRNLKDPGNESSYDDLKWLVRYNLKANGFRLPTESEWEYAARGGIYSKGYVYAGSNDLNEVGWYRKNSHSICHGTGIKIPNELGLFDMSGNLFEWCWDWYGDYPKNPLKDPQWPESGRGRVLRGGSWRDAPRVCRVSYRHYYGPRYRYNLFGLRLSRTAP